MIPVRQLEEREKRLFAEIDKMFIPSTEIDGFEETQFADQIKPSGYWRDDLVRMLEAPQSARGTRLPWDDEGRFRVRPAELTIWSGYNGHGKSLVLTQVILSAMKQGEKAAIASLELNPVQTLRRMVCQASCLEWDEITTSAIDDFFDSTTDFLSLYSEVGDIEPHRVIAMCRYCASHGIGHVVIDSLMKCGTVEGEYSQEKKLVNSLQNIAKNTGIHIHLVAHAKKGKDEFDMPGKFDVAGSTMITNIADNVMTVSRNKRKEIEIMKGSEGWEEKPDAYLQCSKQRHGDWEGIIPLWFHQSGQFSGRRGWKMQML
jgi:twinkle protein